MVNCTGRAAGMQPNGGGRPPGRNTFGTCYGETGLKIQPDVFRHDNCEQFTLNRALFFHFFTKKGVQNSSTVHIDS